MVSRRPTRRDLLGGVATGALLSTAGCLQTLGFRRESAWRDPPLAENRPDAVYVPAVTEGMRMYGQTTAGRYRAALTYSYPHRFWTISGAERSKNVVEPDHDIHLMVTLWDTETGSVLPLDSGVTIEIRRDGDLVSEEVAYPMLSQQMGFHYGSNYALEGDGEYEALVHVGGVSLSRTGAFAGAFESARTATIPFEFRSSDLTEIPINRPDDAGARGAIPPMEMDGVPVGRAPAVDALPGRHLGSGRSGDAVFDGFVVEGDAERFGADSYLYVSARTPHNGIVVPMMGLEATLTRDGETVSEGRLRRTLDPDLGYHYGASVPGIRAGDELTVTPTIPPQVARHDGYETAFFEMGAVTVSV